MIRKRPTPSVAARLCTHCGLCCDGVLFDRVPVEEIEHERLTRLGFQVLRFETGKAYFQQACSKFDGTHCTVYEQRPESCRSFRCELFKSVERDHISLSKALSLVQEAKEVIGRLRPMLAGQPPKCMGEHWAASFESWQRSSAAERAMPSKINTVAHLTALNRILDRYFRKPKDRWIKES